MPAIAPSGAVTSGNTRLNRLRPFSCPTHIVETQIPESKIPIAMTGNIADCHGDPQNILNRDELLDNVMLYWITETAASSARLYWESFGRARPYKVTVPTGVAVFPKEIVPPVRHWMAEAFPNIQHWSEMPKGGHFAAFEQPELFVQEVRSFFRQLRIS